MDDIEDLETITNELKDFIADMNTDNPQDVYLKSLCEQIIGSSAEFCKAEREDIKEKNESI